MSESKPLDRRGFVGVVVTFLSTVMGAVIGIPAVGYLLSPATKTNQTEAWISVGPVENYELGKPTLFSFTRTKVNGWEKTVNSYGAYVVRFSPDQVKVYSNMCTHLSCRVSWKDEASEYQCPCHDAHFSKDGKVTGGPPPRALDEYETKMEDGNLLIHLKEG